jgi:hypothetical protein
MHPASNSIVDSNKAAGSSSAAGRKPANAARHAGQAEAVEIKIQHRRRVQRQHLAHDQPADDGDAERRRISRRRRSSSASGSAPSMAAMVVIMIGRNRRGRLRRSPRGGMSRVRSASNAKSIIRMAFFLTMPISRITPISAMMLNSVEQQQRQHRADAGRGQGGQDGDRMHVGFRTARRARCRSRSAPTAIRSGSLLPATLEGLRGAGEAAMDAGRHADLAAPPPRSPRWRR